MRMNTSAIPEPQGNLLHALWQVEHKHFDGVRLGYSLRLRDDAVRLGQRPFMNFALHDFNGASWVQGLAGQCLPKLHIQNFGLLGPNGALPYHLTEHAYTRIHHFDDHTFTEFLDVFHHRVYSLFYRAWSQAQPQVAFTTLGAFNPFTRRLGQLVGARPGAPLDEPPPQASAQPNLPARGALVRHGLPDHFTRSSKTLEGLQALLHMGLGCAVRVHPFQGQWLTLRSPHRPWGQGLQRCMLGRRAWDCQSLIGIQVGPMPYAAYKAFWPGGAQRKRLHALARHYLALEYDATLHLLVDHNTIEQTPVGGLALGRNAWLGRVRKPSQACVSLGRVVAHFTSITPFKPGVVHE